MSDLISRQAAIKAVGATTWAGFRLEKLPSAQPERKTGKWVDDGTEFGLCCSECETTFDDYFEGNKEEIQLRKIPKFCPNCGADMRGDKHG